MANNETINTKRLVIRRFSCNDGDSLYEYLSDQDVVHFEPYPPKDLGQCREAAKQMSVSGDFWAVCLPGGNLLGQVYLSEKEQKTWEVGYVFNKKYHGHGYATEAVNALVERLFQSHAAHRITAACNPENIRSWKLLERLGLRREGYLKKNVYFQVDGRNQPIWQDTYIYGILDEEWLGV